MVSNATCSLELQRKLQQHPSRSQLSQKKRKEQPLKAPSRPLPPSCIPSPTPPSLTVPTLVWVGAPCPGCTLRIQKEKEIEEGFGNDDTDNGSRLPTSCPVKKMNPGLPCFMFHYWHGTGVFMASERGMDGRGVVGDLKDVESVLRITCVLGICLIEGFYTSSLGTLRSRETGNQAMK